MANTGDTARTFATSFAGATTAGGATITVSPAEVTVPAGGTAEVTVTLTADPATLARDIDPTQETTYLGGGVAREYVTSISGRLVLTPTDGPELRVPVQAAPKPFSELTTPSITFAADQTEAPLTVDGSGGRRRWLVLADGAVRPHRDQPGARAGRRHRGSVGHPGRGPEVRRVRVDRTRARRGGSRPGRTATIALGIATYGEWGTLGGAVVPIIDTDIDGDGIWDLETYVWKYAADLDLTTVETYALEYDPATGYALGDMLDIYEANGLSGVAGHLGVRQQRAGGTDEPRSGRHRAGRHPDVRRRDVLAVRRVTERDRRRGGPVHGRPVRPAGVVRLRPDRRRRHALVPRAAGRRRHGAPLGRRARTTDLLVLHTHNATGERAQVVDVVVQAPKDASVTVAIAPRTVPRGVPVPVSVVIRSAGAPPTGVVEVHEGDQLLGSANVLAHPADRRSRWSSCEGWPSARTT